MNIHPTAIISPKASLDDSVAVGPYSIIGDEVNIGKGTVVGPHVVIEGPTTIGERCRISQFASIGGDPQDLKYKGEKCPVIIGSDNTIREFVTINRSTAADIGTTALGDHNLIMAYCHVAHNCRLGNHIIMSNAVNLAGHIHVEDHVTIGGLTGIHQFTRVGCHAMVAGASAVAQDVPPYTLASGNHAKLFGLNLIGLQRRGFSDDSIQALKKAYRTIFRSSLLLSNALDQVAKEHGDVPEVAHLLEFIRASQRGICR